MQQYKDNAVKQYGASPGVTRGQAVVRQGRPNKEGFLFVFGQKLRITAKRDTKNSNLSS